MHAVHRLDGRSGRRLPTLGASFLLAVGCSGALAAQASAATLAVAQPCVVNADASAGSPMTVTGTGFTPGDTIELQTTSGGGFGTAVADATGNISTLMTAPTLPNASIPAAAPFTVTATDSLTPLPVNPTATFMVANLAVGVHPARAVPGKKVTWTFSGFVSGANIYAHYLHGKKVTATAKFGRANGPCGLLKTKAVFYPGKAKYPTYKVQFDDSRRFLASALPRFIGIIYTHIPV
ncbi:MAG: hypothetical protein QOJ25_2989 [Solirubrobacteraceae bacterium]|jgi:hypothetical protein|nr:hypothetical protein [Solirubrobacteraceae bacterium]